jgi:hypothetical protein
MTEKKQEQEVASVMVQKTTSKCQSTRVLTPDPGTRRQCALGIPIPYLRLSALNNVGLSVNGVQGPRLDPTMRRVPDPSL